VCRYSVDLIAGLLSPQSLEEAEKQLQEERAGLGRLEATQPRRDKPARTLEDSRDEEDEDKDEEEEEEEDGDDDESGMKRLFKVRRDFRMSIILQEALCKRDTVLAALTERWGAALASVCVCVCVCVCVLVDRGVFHHPSCPVSRPLQAAGGRRQEPGGGGFKGAAGTQEIIRTL